MAKRFFGKKIDVKDESSESAETTDSIAGQAETESDHELAEEIDPSALDEALSSLETSGSRAVAEENISGISASSKKANQLNDANQLNNAELERVTTELADVRDKYIRSVAELDNVVKRHTKERADFKRYEGESLARDLLDTIDDLERACAQSGSSDGAEILRGVQLIKDRFISVLERHGIVSVDAAGKIFDPKQHEALTSVPTEEHPSGTIIEQFRKAFMFKDKLLRPAQVVVAVAPKSAKEDNGEES